MMYGSTATSQEPGCRYCGCTCYGGTACSSPTMDFGWGNVVVYDILDNRWSDRAEERLRDMLAGLKLMASISIPDWMIELCALPRRMKRPFPADLPGPSLCYSVARPSHRRYRRIRRLWRHAC